MNIMIQAPSAYNPFTGKRDVRIEGEIPIEIKYYEPNDIKAKTTGFQKRGFSAVAYLERLQTKIIYTDNLSVHIQNPHFWINVTQEHETRWKKSQWGFEIPEEVGTGIWNTLGLGYVSAHILVSNRENNYTTNINFREELWHRQGFGFRTKKIFDKLRTHNFSTQHNKQLAQAISENLVEPAKQWISDLTKKSHTTKAKETSVELPLEAITDGKSSVVGLTLSDIIQYQGQIYAKRKINVAKKTLWGNNTHTCSASEWQYTNMQEQNPLKLWSVRKKDLKFISRKEAELLRLFYKLGEAAKR